MLENSVDDFSWYVIADIYKNATTASIPIKSERCYGNVL